MALQQTLSLPAPRPHPHPDYVPGKLARQRTMELQQTKDSSIRMMKKMQSLQLDAMQKEYEANINQQAAVTHAHSPSLKPQTSTNRRR